MRRCVGRKWLITASRQRPKWSQATYKGNEHGPIITALDLRAQRQRLRGERVFKVFISPSQDMSAEK